MEIPRTRTKIIIIVCALFVGLLVPINTARADGNPPPTETETPLPTSTPEPTPTLELVDTPIIPTEAPTPTEEPYPQTDLFNAPLPPQEEQPAQQQSQASAGLGSTERLLIGAIIIAAVVLGLVYAVFIMRRTRGGGG